MEVICSSGVYDDGQLIDDDSSRSACSPVISSGRLKAKNKKKSQQHRTSTPYDGSQCTVTSSIKLKSKSPENMLSVASENAPTEPSSPSDQTVLLPNEAIERSNGLENSYDLLLQQQQLYLQWQKEEQVMSTSDTYVSLSLSCRHNSDGLGRSDCSIGRTISFAY
jgi:hypothetical protein